MLISAPMIATVSGTNQQEYEIESEPAMLDLGAEIAAELGAGKIVFLKGDLGAGKTTLVRGILYGKGHTGAVTSPTYTLVEPYLLGELQIYHFDLYRLQDAVELEMIGIRDMLDSGALCLFEWPDRGQGVLPAPDWLVTIETSGDRRRVRVDRDPAH